MKKLCIIAFIALFFGCSSEKSEQNSQEINDQNQSAVITKQNFTLTISNTEKIELEKTTIKSPSFPVFANYSASSISEPEKIKESLYYQSFSKVRFTESINNIVMNFTPTNYKEFGNGNVLSGLIRKINKDIKPLQ